MPMPLGQVRRLRVRPLVLWLAALLMQGCGDEPGRSPHIPSLEPSQAVGVFEWRATDQASADAINRKLVTMLQQVGQGFDDAVTHAERDMQRVVYRLLLAPDGVYQVQVAHSGSVDDAGTWSRDGAGLVLTSSAGLRSYLAVEGAFLVGRLRLTLHEPPGVFPMPYSLTQPGAEIQVVRERWRVVRWIG